MTDLQVSVRLKADGSALVGQLRLSAEEAAKLGSALDRVGDAGRRLSGATDASTQAQREGAVAAGALGAQQGELTRVLASTAAQAGEAGRAAAELAAGQRTVADAAGALAAGQRQIAQATGGAAAAQASATQDALRHAQALTEVAQRERDAAAASTAAARERYNGLRGVRELDAANPTVTIKPREAGAPAFSAPGSPEEIAAASRDLAAARGAETAAEETLAARLRDTAAAQATADAAATKLQQSSRAVASAADKAADAYRQGAAAAGDVTGANERVAAGATAAAAAADAQAAAARSAATAAGEHGAAVNGEAAATGNAAREAAELAAAEQRLAGATTTAEREAAALALAQARLEQAQRRNSQATKESADASNRNAYAIRNVGQQVGDFGLQVASGQDPARAFGQQAGQLGYALSEMEGKLGKVGAFLVGPWGIALTIGAAVAAPFIERLFESGAAAEESRDKLEKAAAAADSFGNAQSAIGKVIDLTTGKLKTQNQVLIQTIKLQAQSNLLAAQKEIDANKPAPALNLKAPSPIGGGSLYGVGGGDLDAAVASSIKIARQQGQLDRITASLSALVSSPDAEKNPTAYAAAIGRGIDAAIAGVDRLATGGKLAGKSLEDVKLQLIKIGTAGNNKAAALESITALNGGPIAPDLVPYSKAPKAKVPRSPKAKVAPDYTRLESEVTNDIASLTAQFTDAPTFIEKARAAVARLDRDIAELARKKPPNFQSLIDQAERAKDVIQANIAKPYNDFLRAQGEQFQIQQALIDGGAAQSDAMRTILSLQRQMGPLTDAQRDGVLATVQGLQAQARQLDILHAKQQLYLDSLSQIKGIVQDATQAFVRGDLGQFIKTPGKLLQAFQTLQGQALFDKLFDGAFRKLQDNVTGTHIVEDASTRMAAAVNGVSAQTRQTTTALGQLASAATQAASAVGTSGSRGGAALGTAADGDAALARINGATAGPADTVGQDVVVTARRGAQSPAGLFGDALGQIGKSIASVFVKPDVAASIGSSIGKYAGKGLEGAATGSLVAGIGNSLGLHLSSTGSQLGGALGSITGIPGGNILGSVLGGIVGNLFAPKAKPGGVTVGAVDGAAGITGSSGSDSKLIAASKGLGSAVSDGVNKIVEQLGGTLGSFNVSIGKYKDDLRVNVDGKALGGVKGSGAVGFGDDEAAAVSYAISQAIAQGAVQGLSTAVAKALSSSTDVDKAIAEAVKVQGLETLLGGVTGQLAQIFKTADAQAAERVTLAKKYGLDLLAVEKVNAAQRADLIASTLKNAVGGLQDLLTSLSTGDLYEGSASDRRSALLTQIASAKTDADAGKDGAAATLATLYNQLLSSTKDAFGTAGPEYAADRALATSGATDVIQRENDRIAAASADQKATTAAIATGNALADEGNDLLSTISGKLSTLIDVTQGAASDTGDLLADYSLTARKAG